MSAPDLALLALAYLALRLTVAACGAVVLTWRTEAHAPKARL